MSTLLESSFERFRCLGADCEDTCCIGWWRVNIDKDTYRRYKTNAHPLLKGLFRQAIKLNTDVVGKDKYARIVMAAGGTCPFLDGGLCRIHALLGEQALSPVCASFPRVVNEFGALREFSLDLSCPEAARLVLLDREGVRFSGRDGSNDGNQLAAEPRRTQFQIDLGPELTQVVNEIRAVVIYVLQYREVSIETRLLILGLLLETIEQTMLPLGEKAIEGGRAVIDQAQRLLGGANSLEAEVAAIEPNEALQLKVFDAMLNATWTQMYPRFAACVEEATSGLYDGGPASDRNRSSLRESVTTAFGRHCKPFLQENPHILENYLVHTVFQGMFPFRHEKPLVQYRQLVFNYLAIRLVMVGMATYHERMSDDLTVRIIQSFARYSQNNPNYLPQLMKVLESHRLLDFRDLFLLIPERVQASLAGT